MSRRQIKFRAWDKTRNQMTWGNSNLMMTMGGLKMWQFGYSPPEPVNQDDFILMQYTGLKDKNGKEIYEGDILLCGDSNEEHENFVTEVLFDRGQFRTCHYGFPVHSWCGKDDSWCEVIGNIYENPELIIEKE